MQYVICIKRVVVHCHRSCIHVHCTSVHTCTRIIILMLFKMLIPIHMIVHVSHLKTCIIISCRQGKFYKFDIISKDGRVQTPLGMNRCLEKIVSIAGGEDRYIISESAVVYMYMCISDCCALAHIHVHVHIYTHLLHWFQVHTLNSVLV